MSRRPPAGLDVEPRDSGGYITLLLGGELDIASAPGLQRTVTRLCALPSTRALTLDMSNLTFIDSTGLAAIVYASRVCEQRDIPLEVVRGPQAVQAVFALTGLDELLPFRADGAAAASERGQRQRAHLTPAIADVCDAGSARHILAARANPDRRSRRARERPRLAYGGAQRAVCVRWSSQPVARALHGGVRRQASARRRLRRAGCRRVRARARDRHRDDQRRRTARGGRRRRAARTGDGRRRADARGRRDRVEQGIRARAARRGRARGDAAAARDSQRRRGRRGDRVVWRDAGRRQAVRA